MAKRRNNRAATARAKADAARSRVAVNSTCLRVVEHDNEDKRLRLEFRTSGAIYEYSGVSKRAATNLAKAESVGRYFNRNVRNNYPYERVRASRPRRKAKRTR